MRFLHAAAAWLPAPACVTARLPAPACVLRQGNFLDWGEKVCLAEGAVLRGEVNVALSHLDLALAARADLSDSEVRALYARLMRLGRKAPDGATGVAKLHLHMQQAAALAPDATTAHLEVFSVVRHGKVESAFTLLHAFAARGVALTPGSFDLIIHAGAGRRDRQLAWKAYRHMRRARLVPTAHTLNALLKAETRAYNPRAALRLLGRASASPPRGWPGLPPDAWSLLGGMSAATAAQRPRRVEELFLALLETHASLHGNGTHFERARSGSAAPPPLRGVRKRGGDEYAALSVAAWNMAMRARLQLRDTKGAVALYDVMRRAADARRGGYSGAVVQEEEEAVMQEEEEGGGGERAAEEAVEAGGSVPGDGGRATVRRIGLSAPSPEVDTFNTLIASLGGMGTDYAWLLRDMARLNVGPDAITVSALLRLQTDLARSKSVWRWGRRRRVKRDARLWLHLIEAYVLHGKPLATARLLSLMERDGARRRWADAAQAPEAHNLYMRAQLRAGRPAQALAHFERMEAVASGGACAPPLSRPTARWLRRPPGAAPDAASYTIALKAIRETSDAAVFELTAQSQPPDATGAAPAGLWVRGAARSVDGGAREGRRSAASGVLRRAVQRGAAAAGAGEVNPLTGRSSAALAHAAIAACGGDVAGAIGVWRAEVRPLLRAARAEAAAAGEEEEDDEEARGDRQPGAQPGAELAAVHALLRVCGVGGRPDEALRVVFAVRTDGLEPDASCFNAYLNGKAARPAAAALRSPPPRASSPAVRLGNVARLTAPAYERLLRLECCPEAVRASLGKLQRIRIQFARPPEEDAATEAPRR